MLCLMTVLQRDLGVRTDSKLNDNPDFSDSRDLFIHGIFQGRGGNCSNLPTLCVAIGRRLGYPLRLVKTAHHCFARWDVPKGERFNVECTSTGLVCEHDEYYLSWPRWVSHEEYLAGR